MRPREFEDQADQAGFTLIEMTVVLLVFSIVMAIIFGFLTEVQNTTYTVQSRDLAVGTGGVVSESLSRQIHAATIPSGQTSAVVTASANELVFYSSLGNSVGPTKVDIKTATPSGCSSCGYSNLVETVTQPTLVNGSLAWTGSSQTLVIASGVIVPTPTTATDCSTGSTYTTGIFEYFDSTSTCLPLDTALSPAALDTPSKVENITVTVTTVDTARAKVAPSATFTLQIVLPNVDYAS